MRIFGPYTNILIAIFLFGFARKAFSQQGLYAGGGDGLFNSLYQGYDGNGDVQALSYCRISTRDLLATAQSTANRILQGVCNPRELNDKFTDLEKQIVDQFNVLKTMVLNIEDKLRDQDEKVKAQHRKLHRALSVIRNLKMNKRSTNPDEMITTSSGKSQQVDFYDETDVQFDEVPEQVLPSIRDKEILQFNSTIHNQDGERIFTYYWTVRDITYRMKNWGWKRSLRSNSFYVFQYGYRMYIRIFPNQNGENIYIHVGITKGDYDAALEWPFKLKHKIQILDHDPSEQDISSRVWDPSQLCSGWNWQQPETGDNYECVGLGFPQDVIKTRFYLLNDSLTIKLIVYLD